jgi:transcriptional regulator with XRE-family HTH domain
MSKDNNAVKENKKKQVMGRPTKFSPVLTEQMARMFELGLTDEQVSYATGIARATLSRWKNENPDFKDTIKKAKAAADSQVEISLFRRACGYEQKSEKIFCNKDGKVTRAEYIERYPPDTGAIVFWKKNRNPDRWKDKQEIETTDKTPLHQKLAQKLIDSGELEIDKLLKE